MLENLFKGVFDTVQTASVSAGDFFLCVGTALIIGLVFAILYNIGGGGSRSFVVTLAIIPAVVAVVIMSVNGNVGAGVAVAGAFSLVRFRSAPGSAREIGAIFMAMSSGILAGMGYLGYAAASGLLLGLLYLVYDLTGLGADSKRKHSRTLRITVPEDLEFTHMFDDIFEKYTKKCECTEVKTSNMGSLYRLTYKIVLKNFGEEKALIDELRCRNGNLEINISSWEAENYEL